MKPLELSQSDRQIWNTITEEQKRMFLILFEKYYESCDATLKPWRTDVFAEAVRITDEELSCLFIEDYSGLWSTINPLQKAVAIEMYSQMRYLNSPQLMNDYDVEEVYNYGVPFDVYVLLMVFRFTKNTENLLTLIPNNN